MSTENLETVYEEFIAEQKANLAKRKEDQSKRQEEEARKNRVKVLFNKGDGAVRKYIYKAHWNHPNGNAYTVGISVSTEPVKVNIGNEKIDKTREFKLLAKKEMTATKFMQNKSIADQLPDKFDSVSICPIGLEFADVPLFTISADGDLTTPLKENNSMNEIEIVSGLLDKIDRSLSKKLAARPQQAKQKKGISEIFRNLNLKRK